MFYGPVLSRLEPVFFHLLHKSSERERRRYNWECKMQSNSITAAFSHRLLEAIKKHAILHQVVPTCSTDRKIISLSDYMVLKLSKKCSNQFPYCLTWFICCSLRDIILFTLLVFELESYYFSLSFKFARFKFAHPKVEIFAQF